MIYDVIIIGNGPAGITAAIYLARAKKSVLIIGKDNGALSRPGAVVRNLYGRNTPIDGNTLIEQGIDQIKQLGVTYINDMVLALNTEIGLEVVTASQRYQTLNLILALGKDNSYRKIKGLKTFENKGISFCAMCDAFLFKNQNVAIIGYNEFMLSELKYLEQVTTNITIFTNDNALTSLVSHPIVHNKIIEIKGDTRARHIITETQEYSIDAIFYALDFPKATPLGNQINLEIENNNIVVNEKYESSVPNIYAIGDCIGGITQIVKASYDGMMVADHIINKS